jgi:tRNA pseudouridine55 synthase
MTALRRTMAAGYPLTACITLDEAKALAEEGALTEKLLPLDTALAAYPAITVSAAQAARFRNGGALALERVRAKVDGPVRVYDPDGRCIALGTPTDNELKMTCLLQV